MTNDNYTYNQQFNMFLRNSEPLSVIAFICHICSRSLLR